MCSLFCGTVLSVNAKDYSEEELKDWASCGQNLEHWEKLLREHVFIGAFGDDGLFAGFASINAAGCLHSLFVHKDRQHLGVASLLLQNVHALARSYGIRSIRTEASITARPFFEKHGYRVLRQQKARARRLLLTNFLMQKDLEPEQESGL